MDFRHIFDTITIQRMSFLLLVFTISIIWGYYFGDTLYNPIPIINNRHYMALDKDVFSLFRTIFFSNYFVAIIIVFIGYFTGGVVTIISFIIDGILFGFKLRYLNLEKIGGINGFWEKLIFHAPIEIFGLILMGSIGLKGFEIVSNFVKTQKMILDESLISQRMVYQYFLGTFLLFVAALIESLESKFF
jgi:uncharacterized membrane protein SpoIIM required for sporulation